MNEVTGWLQPTNNFVRKQKNKLLTPRQLYRHKSVQKFVEDKRLTCMPAHRMINHQIKQIMRPTGGPIDMDSFNPKIFCQILAEWSEGRFDQTFPIAWKDKSNSERHKLLKHRYDHAVHPRDRYYIFNPESTVSSTTSDMKEVEAFVQFLMSAIKRKGGMTAYIKEAGYWRIDAMGGVQKELGFYRCWPDEEGGCPGRICQFCGVPNIYSRRDVKPASKPNRTTAKNLPKRDTYDNELLTEEMGWAEKDGVEYNEHPIAWRCRFCFADLSVMAVHSLYHNNYELIEQVIMHFIGGLLDQLKLIRVGDFYDDATHEDKSSIIEHDMAIAKRLLVRLWHGTITVPTSITSFELKNLIKLAPQISIVKSVKANSICPTLSAELAIMTGYMRSVFGSATQLINGSLVKLRDNKQTIYSNYSNWLQPELVDNVPRVGTKLHGPAALSMTKDQLLDEANQLNGLYVLVPTQKAIYNETSTIVKIHNDQALWFTNNKPLGMEMNASTWAMLDSDVVSVQGGYHYIVRIQAGNFVNLNYVTRRMRLHPGNFNWHSTESTITLTLPIPQLAHFHEDNMSIGIKCVTKQLNRDLFRALCIRNIQGKMEFKALCQYAVAFNMRRYTTGKVVLKQEHIDFDLIHFHVFACLYSMRLQNDRQWISKLIMSTMNQQQVKSLIASTLNNLTTNLRLPANLMTFITFVDDASSIMSTGALPESLLMLHSAMPTRRSRDMKLYNYESAPLATNVHRCTHHHSHCKHIFDPNGCECCGAKCEGKLCACCKPVDYRDMLWGYTFDSAMSRLHVRLSGM